MKKRYYKRRPGDMEIRILRDGRTIFLSPDGSLLDLARELETGNTDTTSSMTKESKDHVRNEIEGRG